MKTQTLSLLAAAALLSACASPAPRYEAAPVVSQPKVYFYPTRGQTESQQDRDRYECHGWAVTQTGFDPSRRLAPGDERATVIPARSPGQTIGAAAAVGAVIGAVAAGRGDTAEGAVVGALAGTVVGSAVASAESLPRRVQRPSRGVARYEQESGEFRRAMSACLEGRGYSVK